MKAPNMNCLEFHRMSLAEPDSRDAAYLQHRHECAACRAYAERNVGFEQSLREAMQIDVPADLLPTIKLGQAIAAEDSVATTSGPDLRRVPGRRGTVAVLQRRWAARPVLALAASVVVLVAAGFLGLQALNQPSQSFPDEVIAHIEHELNHLHEPGEVGEAKLAALLDGFGGSIEQDLGKVSYAGTCTIRKQKGLHMVMAGERGPVTVFYVPGEKPGATTRFSADGYQGELVAAGDGSLAIVGAEGEPLAPIISRLDQAIAWNL